MVSIQIIIDGLNLKKVNYLHLQGELNEYKRNYGFR